MNKTKIHCGNYNIYPYADKFAIYDIIAHKKYVITEDEYKSLCEQYEGDWQPICSKIDKYLKENV